MGARKEPVHVTCPDCGIDVWTLSTKLPARCPECRAAHQAALRRARDRRYVDAHRDDPAWRAAREANCRKWRQANPEKARKSVSEWRKRNTERIREKMRQYRDEHRDEFRAYAAKWRDENRDKCRAENRRQYLRRKAEKMKRSGCGGGHVMDVMARAGMLRECPRLHLKASSLPCGKREECFGKVRCENLPANVEFKKNLNGQFFMIYED